MAEWIILWTSDGVLYVQVRFPAQVGFFFLYTFFYDESECEVRAVIAGMSAANVGASNSYFLRQYS